MDGEPGLQELFETVDKVGAKYDDGTRSLKAKRFADKIVDEAMGDVFAIATGKVSRLTPKELPQVVGPDWEAVLEKLANQQQAIRDSGPVAPQHVYVDEYSTRGKRYVRLRATGKRTLPDTHQKTRGLGKFGGSQHRDWIKRCDRRNQLQKIERRVQSIQQWMVEDEKQQFGES